MKFKRICIILMISTFAFSIFGCSSSTTSVDQSVSNNTISENTALENVHTVDVTFDPTSNVDITFDNIIDTFSEKSVSYNGTTDSMIELVQQIANANNLSIDCIYTEVKSGMLEEFSNEIVGFDRALHFKSVDSNLFTGYVFEMSDTTDIVEFSLSLSEYSDINWDNYSDNAKVAITNNGTNLVLYVIHS